MLRTLTMAVLLGLTALLAGCSGGSANLSTPILGPDPNTDCGKKPALCTTMVFYDDPVENLRYECGVNKGLTDSEGRFTCPMGLDVLFYLGANKEVKIGSLRVASSEAISHANGKYVFKDWITPLDLARAEKSTDVSTCSSDVKWKENILRLIRSLDHDGKGFNALEANNRVKMPGHEPNSSAGPTQSPNRLDAVLATVFTPTATVKDFKPCDFANDVLFEGTFGGSDGVLFKVDKALKDNSLTGLDADGEDGGGLLVSKTYASTAFEAVRRQLLGGTYGITGPIGESVTLPTYSSHAFYVDRRGVPFGFGLLRRLTTEGNVTKISYDPFYFPQLPGTVASFAPDGTLTNFMFGTRPDKLNPNAVGKLTLAGRMINNQIWPIASNYNGSGISPVKADLGSWSEKYANGQNVSGSQGGASMHMMAALPTNFSDMDAWKDLVPEGGVLHYNLRLAKCQDYADPCATDVTDPAKFTDLPITILRDGMVITDLNRNCASIDVATLKDTDGAQEYRVGVVGSVRTLGTTKLASLYLAFGVDDLRNDPTWNGLNGLQLIRGQDVEVGLVIASGATNKALKQVAKAGTLSDALWLNVIRYQVTLAEKDPNDPNRKPDADSAGKVFGSERTPGNGCPL